MPLILLVAAVLMIAAGMNNKVSGNSTSYGGLMGLLRDDIAPSDGSVSFLVWIGSIVIVGSIGFIDKLKPMAYAFLVLLFVVLILTHGGFFTQFSNAFGIKNKS